MVGTSFENLDRKSNSKQGFEDEIEKAKPLTSFNASSISERKVCKKMFKS